MKVESDAEGLALPEAGLGKGANVKLGWFTDCLALTFDINLTLNNIYWSQRGATCLFGNGLFGEG